MVTESVIDPNHTRDIDRGIIYRQRLKRGQGVVSGIDVREREDAVEGKIRSNVTTFAAAGSQITSIA